MAQSIWLISRELRTGAANPDEIARLQVGLDGWHGRWPKDFWDENHSPLFYLVNSAPLLVWPRSLESATFSSWGWWARLPSLLFAVTLASSLWYVARRLYGNTGGYISLTLYCFAPAVVRSSALWFAPPEMGQAWGAFGAIFTAIAVAHTLYAPREVVLWSWRRILLLGLSLVLAVGSQFSLLALAPVALLFMLYVAPVRRLAGLIIWLASCAVAACITLAAYRFHPTLFRQGIIHAKFWTADAASLVTREAYSQFAHRLNQESPALTLLLPIAIAVYLAWPKTRYFGNTAPLLTAGLLTFMGIASPHYPGLGLLLIALPFLYLFVAGVAADLLETARPGAAWACLWGILAAYSLWNLLQLAKLG